MRTGLASVLIALAASSAGVSACADDVTKSCAVPAYLLTSDSTLSRVASAVRAGAVSVFMSTVCPESGLVAGLIFPTWRLRR